MDEQDLHRDLPGFDELLALPRTCHQNIIDYCERLENLITHFDAQDVDDEGRKAARNIVRYFSSSALLHHRDEEEDLFPRLNRQSIRITELIRDLKLEHVKLDQLWEVLSPELNKLPGDNFSDRFLQASREHVNRENREFLPLVANSLSEIELKDIGDSMATRRGVRI